MRRSGAVGKLDSVSLASTKRLSRRRSISVRSVNKSAPLLGVLERLPGSDFLLRPLRVVRRGTRGVMPESGWAARATLRRLATAGARVRPLKTLGWQKMFMRRASELTAESSSRQGQSLRARERRDAVWGLERRRSQAGLAEMARSEAGWKLA